MSATADADTFARYMQQRLSALPPTHTGPLPSVHQLTIPGFTHPVRECYLEDILEWTGHVVGRASK